MSRLVLAFALALTAAAAAAATPPAEAAGPTALVVIDVQEFYFPGGALPLVQPEAAAANAGRLLERFRKDGNLVVHVGHEASAGRAFASAVTPRPDETVLYKREVNAFRDTPLLQTLRDRGIARVVLCGMQTHMCLEAAARAAADYGFAVVVVGDACATRDLTYGDTTVPAAEVHAATLATLDRVYGRVTDTASFLAEAGD